MKRYPVPAAPVRREMSVSNSRFIASLTSATSVEDARAFIQQVRSEFRDATHNVPAFLIGFGASVIAHCSDDGEPSGTAGRPALAVLRGSGLGDVAVVVTRYFGGTLLGTGGLVRAYGGAVSLAVEAVPRAMRLLTHTIMLGIPYALFEKVRTLVPAFQGQIIDEQFAAEVTITARFGTEDLPAFQSALRDLTAGALQAIVVDTGEVNMPIEPEETHT